MPRGSRPACLSQSSSWGVESTWSSCLPLGNTVSSCRYSGSQPAAWAGEEAVLDHRRLGMHPHDLVGLRLVAGDGVQAQLDQFLDQLGAEVVEAAVEGVVEP